MKILLLAGTYEARIIAKVIDKNLKYSLISSLAGITKNPIKISKKMRCGGFGGQSGLAKFISENNIYCIIDATHPFATKISHNAKTVCNQLDIPYLLCERPPWIKTTKDKWFEIDNENQLKPYLSDGDLIFVASGRQSVAYFKSHKNIKLICRQIHDPELPFPHENGSYLIGRPPFSLESEIKLFQELNIDWLLVKNSGGSQSEAKLIAARELGIRVAMINRPNILDGHNYSDTTEVIKQLYGLSNE